MEPRPKTNQLNCIHKVLHVPVGKKSSYRCAVINLFQELEVTIIRHVVGLVESIQLCGRKTK